MGESEAGGLSSPERPPDAQRRWFVLVLAVFVILALIYSAIIPLGYGPDEPRHYRFVTLMVEQHKLPRVLPEGGELGRAIAIHPPLYYSILSILYLPAQRLGGDWWAQRLLRLLSPLFGAATLALVWGACRRVFPGKPWLALLIPAVQALWPHFLLDHSVINSDNGANLAGALFVYFLVSRPGGAWPVRSALLGGLVVGIGALMKGQLLLCLPPVLVCIMAWDHGRRFALDPRFWRAVGLAALVALILAGPWYARNLVLYGQINYVARGFEGIPPGMSLLDAWSQGIVQALVSRAIVGVFHSIWVQVGWFPDSMADALYAGLGLLLVVSAVGWVRLAAKARARTLKLEPGQARRFAALFGPFVCIYPLILYVATFVHMGVYQGGRYAMFALPGFAAFLALGWRTAIPARLRLAGAILVLAFFLLLNALSMWNLVTFSNPTYAPGHDFWTPISD